MTAHIFGLFLGRLMLPTLLLPSTVVTSYLNGPFVEIFKLAYHGFVFCLPATVFLVEFVYISPFERQTSPGKAGRI
jgi:hypothetical protein